MKGCGYYLIKVYLQVEMTGGTWPMGHSLLTPGLYYGFSIQAFKANVLMTCLLAMYCYNY